MATTDTRELIKAKAETVYWKAEYLDKVSRVEQLEQHIKELKQRIKDLTKLNNTSNRFMENNIELALTEDDKEIRELGYALKRFTEAHKP